MTGSTIRLVACDMDGTLLNDAKEKPADFIPWVVAHPDIRVVIASGRQYATLRADFEEIADRLYYLADNGALVFYRDELLHVDEIDKAIVMDTLARIDGITGMVPIVCGANSAYMRHSSADAEANGHMYYKKLAFVEEFADCVAGDEIVKIACFLEKGDPNDVIRRLDGIDPCLAAVISGDQWIDVLLKGVNKGTGVRAIQEKYGILPEESMAFGDFLNDYELLMACTESYAMANAHPKLKEIAAHETASNEEDGVMKILRML